MLEKGLKFQVVTKNEKMNSLQPLLPTINFNISDKQNNYTKTIDHQFMGNRYCETYSQKRNQIKSIRRSKGVGYTKMVDNYKNVSRQSQENPFQGELLIKQFKNNRNKKQQLTKRQNTVMDYQQHKYQTIEAMTKNIRYKSSPKKLEYVETEIKITPYIHQNKKFQFIDYYYIV